MDDEATSMHKSPTGLLDYGRHARPELRRPQTEPEWTKRLAVLLAESGRSVRAEVRYPSLSAGRHNRCDLVIGGCEGPLWLELKGAWKTYWARRRGDWIYRSYLLHPIVPGLDAKSHTAALDVRKLATIKPKDGSHVGLLLVGFDSQDAPMDHDVAELTRLSNLAGLTWRSWSKEWDDQRRPGERVRVWLWIQPTQEADRN